MLVSKAGAGLLALTTAIAMLTALCGCTNLQEYVHNDFKVGPNYEPPDAPVAEHWIDDRDGRVRTTTDDICEWWTIFGDPILDSLIVDAYRQNLDIREACFRILQAHAELGIARGSLWPQTQMASASYDHRLTSRGMTYGGIEMPQIPYDTWYSGFNLAWELDFWGRFRRTIQAADAHLDASVDDYNASLVSLLYSVAQQYIDIRKSQQAIELLGAMTVSQRTLLHDADDRFRVGKVNALDPAQARSNLARTEALALNYRKELRSHSNALCTLLAIPPQDLQSRLGPGPIPSPPLMVSVGMPADLLSRRPDVRAAERAAAEQAQKIGIAQADFYPTITITGALGYQANEFPDLLSSPAFNGYVGPVIGWKILNYGRIANHVRFQDAKFNQLVTAYQSKVLKASREVEDAINDFLLSQEIVSQRELSVRSLETAYNVVVDTYLRGIQDYTSVTLVTQDYVLQQLELNAARRDLSDAFIRIFAALGGGWQANFEPPPTPPADAGHVTEEPPRPGSSLNVSG